MESLQRFFKSLSGYSRPFWVANLSELFERIAFYGTTSMLVLYLTKSRGLEEGEAMRLNGLFGMLVYGLPVFSGFLADLMGYRRALMLAYGLLAAGYFLVGQLSTYWSIAGALLVVALGASLVKPTITGTVQKTCDGPRRAVGFSIYYTLVNIGGLLGPQSAGRVSKAFSPESNFLVCGAAALVALALVSAFFREPASATPGERKTLGAFGRDFLRVVGNLRLVTLFLLVAGFWIMFFSLYGAFPLYVTKQLGGDETDVGNLLSIESMVVIALTVVVGALTRNLLSSRAFTLGVLLAAIGMALIGAYPSTWFAAAGVIFIALGELTLSAHFYKYLGDMAPPDQVGMYMGFAFLPIALGYFGSGVFGSWMRSLTADSPSRIWFAFAGVGLAAVVGLVLLTEDFKPKKTAPTATFPAA
ncbi:MAG: MFS transporter [Deltaproteobacteria bacterium]|nr:MFS transporter [Deltaproteobacteria bacterium]